MKQIVNSIITTVVGLALAGIGVFVYVDNIKELQNWSFAQIAAPGLLIVAGIVLILSPDEFVKKFFQQFKKPKQ